MRDENEALLMRLYETIEDFTQRMKRSPLAEELAVMHDIDKAKVYTLLRNLEARGMIEVNRKKRPAQIVLAKKKPVKKAIKEPATVFKGKQQLVTSVKIGDLIEIMNPLHDKDFNDKEPKRVFEIIGIYPYCVLGRDVQTGMKRSIGYGDLIKRGLERQDNKLEAMRR